MNPHSNPKNILILGGNPETAALVEVGNAMGLTTCVVDPYPGSPAKRPAAKSYDVDVKDFAAIDRIVRDEHIDGILVGVADPLVPFYQQLCQRYGFPCYATEKVIRALASKASFAQTCSEYGITITPNYPIDLADEDQIAALPFPVVVKPVDCGAGVGISICHSREEFKQGVDQALAISLQKKLLIEKFMECDDIFVYYTFVDGEAHLSALADRHKTQKQGNFSSVCLAAEYPSQHSERFVREVHPHLLRMFQGLGIQNGVLLIQFFVDAQNFYAYDPGFRLQGEAPHLYLQHFNGFDQRAMLLNFALSGTMFTGDFAAVNDHEFAGARATTIWVLLKAGKIGQISGLEAIKSHPNVIQVLQRFAVGDSVTPSMIGTERQVLARIYTVARDKAESADNVRFINRHLSVLDDQGENMILDRYAPGEAP